jgi:uncharacterized protein YjeT (DUF2065 family)
MNLNTTSSRSGLGERREMPRMRLSMFYLAGYLLPVGLLLMFVPQLTMKLLQTNHAYDDLGLRMGGVFLFALGMIVVSMIVNHAAEMYSTTLFVRAFIIASLLVLFGIYRDPALLAISAVVIIGWVLTFISWRKDTATAR